MPISFDFYKFEGDYFLKIELVKNMGVFVLGKCLLCLF
jgi:hypothetical protein